MCQVILLYSYTILRNDSLCLSFMWSLFDVSYPTNFPLKKNGAEDKVFTLLAQSGRRWCIGHKSYKEGIILRQSIYKHGQEALPAKRKIRRLPHNSKSCAWLNHQTHTEEDPHYLSDFRPKAAAIIINMELNSNPRKRRKEKAPCAAKRLSMTGPKPLPRFLDRYDSRLYMKRLACSSRKHGQRECNQKPSN